jgi:hypothetical protein
MKRISITIALLSLYSLSKAQTSDSKTSDPALNALEKPHGKNDAVRIKVTEVYSTSSAEVQKSDYNNWESEILKELNIDYIPKDFPIYQSTMTDLEYKSIITTWAKENPSYLKQPK